MFEATGCKQPFVEPVVWMVWIGLDLVLNPFLGTRGKPTHPFWGSWVQVSFHREIRHRPICGTDLAGERQGAPLFAHQEAGFVRSLSHTKPKRGFDWDLVNLTKTFGSVSDSWALLEVVRLAWAP